MNNRMYDKHIMGVFPTHNDPALGFGCLAQGWILDPNKVNQELCPDSKCGGRETPVPSGVPS